MTGNSIQSYLNDVIAGHVPLTLALMNEEGDLVGEMRPLTMSHADQPEVLQKLTDWRNQNMSRFLTQFQATPERTKKWLVDVVLKVPGQMLFLMYEEGKLIGHLGFKCLTDEDGVLDNAIKGEQTNAPKIFVYAHKVLAHWLFTKAQIQRLYGYVLTDNIAAIMMNRQIGWTGWVRCPLIKSEKNGDIIWQLGDEDQQSPSSKYCFKIVLQNNS